MASATRSLLACTPTTMLPLSNPSRTARASGSAMPTAKSATESAPARSSAPRSGPPTRSAVPPGVGENGESGDDGR